MGKSSDSCKYIPQHKRLAMGKKPVAVKPGKKSGK